MESVSVGSLVLAVLLVLHAAGGEQKELASTFYNSLSHVKHCNDKLCVADRSNIDILNKDFTVHKNISTCNKDDCNNFMKVFLMNEARNELATCGSENGVCQLTNLSILSDSSTLNNGDIERRIIVSSDTTRPAKAIYTPNGQFLIAVTYGSGLESTEESAQLGKTFGYSYAFSTWPLSGSTFSGPEKNLKLVLNKTEKIKSPEDYLIYFKGVFSYNEFTFFTSNQKKFVGSNEFVSKLVRFCDADTEKATPGTSDYLSYVDFEISCEKDGKKYNLIQDSVVVNYEGTEYFIGAFTAGNNPEKPAGDSLVCVTKLADTDSSVYTAWKQFGNCSDDQTFTSDGKRYFPKNWDQCNNDKNTFTCASGSFSSLFNYVLGVTSLELTPIYKLPGVPYGHVTKMFGRTLEPHKVDLHIGTSAGRVLKFNFYGDGRDLEMYSGMTVHNGISIIDFVDDTTTDTRTMFVASEKKIVKYAETTCSEYTTCADTMRGKDPLCGWCIYEGKSTWKTTCKDQNFWLSSLDDCVTLTLDPEGQNVEKSNEQEQLKLTLVGLNSSNSQNSIEYECRYKDESGIALKNVTANGNLNGNLNCTATFDDATHGNVTLELWSKKNVQQESAFVYLASAQFLYFQCSNFTSCGQCTLGTRGDSCMWCPDEHECQLSESDESDESERKIKSESESDERESKSKSKSKSDESKSKSKSNSKSESERRKRSRACHGKDSCPQLQSVEPEFIPSGETLMLTFKAPKLKKNEKGQYFCLIDGIDFSATVGTYLTCYVNVLHKDNLTYEEYSVSILYQKNENKKVKLVDENNLKVRVYQCGVLGKDCSHCKAVNSTRYSCKWQNGTCTYGNDTSPEECPAPTIDDVTPNDGWFKGGTTITIRGTNLGKSISSIQDVIVGDKGCNLSTKDDEYDPSNIEDYMNPVPNQIVCTIQHIFGGGQNRGMANNVNLTVSSKTSVGMNMFTYKKPNITGIYPNEGPIAGGTLVTLTGTNLAIGNRDVGVWFNNNDFDDCSYINTTSDVIQCYTPAGEHDLGNIGFYMNGNVGYQQRFQATDILKFTRLDDPVVGNVTSSKGTISGGTEVMVNGDFLDNAQDTSMVASYAGIESVIKCKNVTRTSAVCGIPKAPPQAAADLKDMLGAPHSGRRKRATDCTGCVEVDVVLQLDGVTYEFKLQYFPDPQFNQFEGDKITVFKSDTQRLTLTGSNLNLVVEKEQIDVTIGLEKCIVVELTENQLICTPPKDQPKSGIPGKEYPEVNVRVGNLQQQLGYIRYEAEKVEKTIKQITVIAPAVGGSVVAMLVIGVVLGVMKYRKVGKKASALSYKLNEMEKEIKMVAREEFFHMHNTMTGVNKSLVEQGFPYHDYQQYAFNCMFPTDFMDNHPLLHEPVVRKGKVTDDTRMQLKKSMDSLEQLIHNKFFLVSVLTTMEGEKKFFLKEKSNLAGNLCAILLGRMDYLQEVISVLMANLVESSTGKKTQKTLFRRCESITEKLLNNWLYLCQYHKVKASLGSPLYLMFKAMQLTIESGPIDAITSESKYTLTEERLLRKWTNSSEEGSKDLKLEAKPLTLNVVVDNGQDVFPCKVLDCDSITQVKHKCLAQIYVNYPASKLEIHPEELHLEWHEGFGGSLNLQNKDNTSQKDGEWIRLNTLAHYNVKDNSNMILIDPRALDDQENYVNLSQVFTNVDNGNMDAKVLLATDLDEEDPPQPQYWHLVKPDSESSTQQKSVIEELYLNRLFTTKQCIMEYLRPLFDILLNKDTCPPTTQFLYSFLDDLAKKNRVDSDTLHLWKSHSYIIRVWANMVRNPSNIFDVDIPDYVESSLDIVGQVFIDSCSLSPQNHTKDSPPQKLIFMKEVNHYRENLKAFFREVQETTQTPEELREHLLEVNKLQVQNTSFNKMAALYRFYQQLEPYLDDIIEDLETCKETSNLHLNKKFEQVVAVMTEEEEC